TNAGVLAPGSSPGILDVTGNYVQTAAGVLKLELAGRNATSPTQFDQLRVTGTATLAGSVQATILNGFTPAPGDEFKVLTSSQIIGASTDQNLATPGPGRRLNLVYLPSGIANNVTLQTQNVPPLELGYAVRAGAAGSDRGTTLAVDAAGNA